MMDLFIGVMEQNIKEDVYAAYEAMLSYIIHTSEIGVVLSLHGFNHKLMVFTSHITRDVIQRVPLLSVRKSHFTHRFCLKPFWTIWQILM